MVGSLFLTVFVVVQSISNTFGAPVSSQGHGLQSCNQSLALTAGKENGPGCTNPSSVQLPPDCPYPLAATDVTTDQWHHTYSYIEIRVIIRFNQKVLPDGVLIRLMGIFNGTSRECGCTTQLLSQLEKLGTNLYRFTFDETKQSFAQCLQPYTDLTFRRNVAAEVTSLPLAGNASKQAEQTHQSGQDALFSCEDAYCHPLSCHHLCIPSINSANVSDVTNTSALLVWTQGQLPLANDHNSMALTEYNILIFDPQGHNFHNKTMSVPTINYTLLVTGLQPQEYYIYQVIVKGWLSVYNDSIGQNIRIPVVSKPFIIRHATIEKIDGGFSEWNTSQPCQLSPSSSQCGQGMQLVTRLCNNPLPRNGGRQCPKDGFQQWRACHVDCPVEQPSTQQPISGGWSLFRCVPVDGKDCGNGTYRRTCDNPAPKFNGTFCQGVAVKDQACSIPCKKNSSSIVEIVVSVWAGIAVFAAVLIIYYIYRSGRFKWSINSEPDVVSTPYSEDEPEPVLFPPEPPINPEPVDDRTERCIYISYGRESKAHDDDMRTLAEWLTDLGFKVALDLYERHQVAAAIGGWYDHKIAKEVDCIVLVMTDKVREAWVSLYNEEHFGQRPMSEAEYREASEGCRELLRNEMRHIRAIRLNPNSSKWKPVVIVHPVQDCTDCNLPATLSLSPGERVFHLFGNSETSNQEWEEFGTRLCQVTRSLVSTGEQSVHGIPETHYSAGPDLDHAEAHINDNPDAGRDPSQDAEDQPQGHDGLDQTETQCNSSLAPHQDLDQSHDNDEQPQRRGLD